MYQGRLWKQVTDDWARADYQASYIEAKQLVSFAIEFKNIVTVK
jgi:hypothetical protein